MVATSAVREADNAEESRGTRLLLSILRVRDDVVEACLGVVAQERELRIRDRDRRIAEPGDQLGRVQHRP